MLCCCVFRATHVSNIPACVDPWPGWPFHRHPRPYYCAYFAPIVVRVSLSLSSQGKDRLCWWSPLHEPVRQPVVVVSGCGFNVQTTTQALLPHVGCSQAVRNMRGMYVLLCMYARTCQDGTAAATAEGAKNEDDGNVVSAGEDQGVFLIGLPCKGVCLEMRGVFFRECVAHLVYGAGSLKTVGLSWLVIIRFVFLQ